MPADTITKVLESTPGLSSPCRYYIIFLFYTLHESYLKYIAVLILLQSTYGNWIKQLGRKAVKMIGIVYCACS